MAVRKAILILTLTLFVSAVQAQSALDSFKYYSDSTLVDLKVDKLNNQWFIYDNKIIRKSIEKAYNDTIENIHIPQLSLDLTIPLKNLFYYRDKNRVEIKNSRWGTISSFKLDALQIFQPCFVNFSTDKMIWILDVSSNTLYKLNENGVKISQKPNPFKVENKFFYPTELIQLKNECIALDKTYGIFILDDYGNLVQHLKTDSTQKIFEYKGKVYLSHGKTLIQFQATSKMAIDLTQTKKLHFPNTILSLQTYNENALILFENKRIYELKNFESLFE
jgi:hypothetical protein